STQYQLLRSPRSSPMVSVCREKFLLCLATAMLTFFIAGLLFICALSTSITWERTPHPVRRPAFSSHLFNSESRISIDNHPPCYPRTASRKKLRAKAKVKVRPCNENTTNHAGHADVDAEWHERC